MKILALSLLAGLAACGKKPSTEPASPAPAQGNADPNAAERYAGGLRSDLKKAESVADRANAAVKKTEESQKALEQAESGGR